MIDIKNTEVVRLVTKTKTVDFKMNSSSESEIQEEVMEDQDDLDL